MKPGSKKAKSAPQLVIRNLKLEDIDSVLALGDKCYPQFPPYSKQMLMGQFNTFPEGQFVAIYLNSIVGYCATFITTEDEALSPHDWKTITGGGFASKHDPNGKILYGMEVFVDPDHRGMRIGQRLYNARKNLCKDLRLKKIVFGGRIPEYSKRKKKFNGPEDYIAKVASRKIRDQVLSFQLRNDFTVMGFLKNYLPSDAQSEGHAAHLMWENPEVDQQEKTKKRSLIKVQNSVRVGSVQYCQRKVDSFEQFAKYVRYFVDVVSDYRGDFVVFPELFTLQLLSIQNKPLGPAEAIGELTRFTAPLKELFHELALRYNINIIGGSHPTKTEDNKILNICYVFLRDGSIHEQVKIHPTPSERYWWNIQGGNKVQIIQTDCGPIGILICYDSEFPELARYLVDQGAKILFVPFCTDERQSYMRVRYCCQARAVENQCYVVMSGNVGNLPGVENMDIQYAQSAVLTPCDFPFARDGIAADTTPNVEMVAFADLRLDLITQARNSGTVLNLKDRRFDLYQLEWKQGQKSP